MVKKRLISLRVDAKQLERLCKSLGCDESKTIRACMNCTDFVIHTMFGGNVTNIFKRRKKDEERDLFEKL